eukprot:7671-Chlamydomonas_euryale.AAC.3
MEMGCGMRQHLHRWQVGTDLRIFQNDPTHNPTLEKYTTNLYYTFGASAMQKPVHTNVFNVTQNKHAPRSTYCQPLSRLTEQHSFSGRLAAATSMQSRTGPVGCSGSCLWWSMSVYMT